MGLLRWQTFKIIFSTQKFLRILVWIPAVLPCRAPKIQALSPQQSNNGRASMSIYLCFLSKHSNVYRQRLTGKATELSPSPFTRPWLPGRQPEPCWHGWCYHFKRISQWRFPGKAHSSHLNDLDGAHVHALLRVPSQEWRLLLNQLNFEIFI